MKIAEFKGEPTGFGGGSAFTATRTMYTYKFMTRQVRKDRYLSTLKSISVYTIFMPESSWWVGPYSEELLDHEQGHFDIAEIAARRTQLAFTESISGSKKKITGSGSTAKQAERELVSKLDKVMKVTDEQTSTDNQNYDATTRHGNYRRNQEEQRRIHRLTLEKLEKLRTGKVGRKVVTDVKQDDSSGACCGDNRAISQFR